MVLRQAFKSLLDETPARALVCGEHVLERGDKNTF
jgi:hypothetical protein